MIVDVVYCIASLSCVIVFSIIYLLFIVIQIIYVNLIATKIPRLCDTHRICEVRERESQLGDNFP